MVNVFIVFGLFLDLIEAEVHIGRECDIDIFRIVEPDGLHRLYEFCYCSDILDSSVIFFLLSDRTHRLSRIVMSWVDFCIIR